MTEPRNPDRSFADLPGSQRRPIAKARFFKPADHGEIVHLTIRVRPKTPFSALQSTVADIYAKPAASRRYLSRDALALTHGAKATDLDEVERLARAYGLSVSRRLDAERSIVLTGPLQILLRLFPADVSQCQLGGKIYRGRQGSIQMPAALAGIVTGVFGYDTRPRQRGPRRTAASARVDTDADTGVAATDYAARYNFPAARAGKTLDGSGTCIAFVELAGNFRADDLQAYSARLGTRVPHVVCVPPERGVPAQTAVADGDAEIMLDTQVAAAIAPGATIAVYFADNQGSGFLQAVSTAVHDSTNNPNVLSISWGGPECLLDAQARQAFSEVFTAAAALGMVVCAASGDHGVADFDALDWDNAIHVDHPAADPLVLACGGTQIDPQTGNEAVWNDGTPFDITAQTGGWASGGGISTDPGVPAYQQGITLPATLDPSGTKGRGVPDLAMIATNYLTILGGAAIASRGTSAVAPLMAGLVARLTQAHGGNIGCLNALLYTTPGLCKPVQTGNNGIAGAIAGYQAGAGWSACTGLGVPDGTAILQALSHPLAEIV